jgi:hypothetical protein
MDSVFCKVTLSGCTLFAEYYFEVLATGPKEEQVRQAQADYEARFGKFESHYCDQCFDWTSIEFELMSRKQSRRLLAKCLLGETEDLQVFRLDKRTSVC